MANKSSSGGNDVGKRTFKQIDESVNYLIKVRDEFRADLELSVQLNQLLRKILTVKLARLTDRPQNLLIGTTNHEAEAKCYQLEQLDLNEIATNSDGTQGGDTKAFKIAASRHSYLNRSLTCKGCKRNFKYLKNVSFETRYQSYRRHCMEECDKYKELGIIGHCLECKLSFASKAAKARHINKYHRDDRNQIKPKWMSLNCFKQSTGLYTFDGQVKCKGCGKTFKRIKSITSGVSIEFDYYVHCIEQCKKYQKLNLIQACKPCGLKFLNFKALVLHSRTFHPEIGISNGNKIRSWMNKEMLRRRNRTIFNSTLNCKGCGQVFKADKIRKCYHAELDYYIHCVEQCKEYQKLNLINRCNQCNKIFLTKFSYLSHAGKCTSL